MSQSSSSYSFKTNLPIYIPNIKPETIPVLDDWMNKEQAENKIVEYIKYILEKQIGKVERIDLIEEVNKISKVYYYNAYCYVKWDKKKEDVEIIQQSILEPHEEARIYHMGEHMKHYWILLENKNPKTEKEANIEKISHKIQHNLDGLHNFMIYKQNNRQIRDYNEYQSDLYIQYLYKSLIDLQKEVQGIVKNQ